MLQKRFRAGSFCVPACPSTPSPPPPFPPTPFKARGFVRRRGREREAFFLFSLSARRFSHHPLVVMRLRFIRAAVRERERERGGREIYRRASSARRYRRACTCERVQLFVRGCVCEPIYIDRFHRCMAIAISIASIVDCYGSCINCFLPWWRRSFVLCALIAR